MQGGPAPADARDPNAYSDGYTLTQGPYVRANIRELKLADEHLFWAVLADSFEYQNDNEGFFYDVQGWYGGVYNKFVVKAEGDYADSRLQENQLDLLWGRAINAYFDTQLGVRLDQYEAGENRQWLAFGVQGLAPYWFELDITGYVGDRGRTALDIEAEYEVRLTQRLFLQPRAEINFYGKDDPANDIGSGLSNASLGLRLRYEIRRQFAPYIGLQWSKAYGDTADFIRADGEDVSETQWVAGIRFWF